jgi:carbonic anhydrase
MPGSEDLVREAKAALASDVPRVPRRHLAVVTCMDARIDPFRTLNAEIGDIHVLRNAGGVVTDDVVRSLLISSRLLEVSRVQVIMHTDCGAMGLDRDAIERQVGRKLPFDLHSFSNLEEELSRGVERLRNDPLLDLPAGVTGYVFHVDSGHLSRVVA